MLLFHPRDLKRCYFISNMDGSYQDTKTGKTVSSSEIPMILDSGDDAISKKAKELDMNLDDGTKDAIVEYYLAQQAEDAGVQRQLDFEKTKYSAMVEGLRKAGLNPFLAMSSLSSASLQNGAGGSSGSYASIANSKRDASVNRDRMATTLLGVIAAALIYTLL